MYKISETLFYNLTKVYTGVTWTQLQVTVYQKWKILVQLESLWTLFWSWFLFIFLSRRRLQQGNHRLWSNWTWRSDCHQTSL